MGQLKSKQEVETVRDAPGVSDPEVKSQQYRWQATNFLPLQYQNEQSLWL